MGEREGDIGGRDIVDKVGRGESDAHDHAMHVQIHVNSLYSLHLIEPPIAPRLP